MPAQQYSIYPVSPTRSVRALIFLYKVAEQKELGFILCFTDMII